MAGRSRGVVAVGVDSDWLLLWHAVCCFFSSRRRHTIFDCDWSSDVCSSDLGWPTAATGSNPSKYFLNAILNGGRFVKSAGAYWFLGPCGPLLLPIPKTVIGGNRHEMKLELTKQEIGRAHV